MVGNTSTSHSQLKMCSHLHLSFDGCVLYRPSPLHVVCISHSMVPCQSPLRPLIRPECAATSTCSSHLAFDRCAVPATLHMSFASRVWCHLLFDACVQPSRPLIRMSCSMWVYQPPQPPQSCLASDECVPYHISATTLQSLFASCVR